MSKRRAEYGPSQGSEMLKGLVKAAREIAMEESKKVTVRMYDGRILEGRIVGVFDSVAGKKIRVMVGALVVTVDETQVVQG